MDTQRYTAPVSGAKLIVLENGNLRVYMLDDRAEWLIGREDRLNGICPDISFQSPIVSRKHGRLCNVEGRWFFIDNPQNLNGTFHNGVKLIRSVHSGQQHTALFSGDILRIDNADLRQPSRDGVMMLFTTGNVIGEWTRFSLLGRKSVTIGRNEKSDIILPLPYLSASHAKLTLQHGQWILSDCKSMAGTFLNGVPVKKEVSLQHRDIISMCDCNVFFMTDHVLYLNFSSQHKHNRTPDDSLSIRPLALKADISSKKVKDHSGHGRKELLRDIHLEIQEGTLVALLGTAGAGKSTVMNCLNGMDLEGVSGTVIYGGVDLMRDFNKVKYKIGNVPQEKTFRDVNTPEEEFYQAARARLPRDMTKQEIMERVDKTLEILGMNNVRRNRNSKLSGGEKTRVNVGIELVADRDLLCLDEPDQGLSPNYKHELFEIMRNLSHEHNKTVLSIIHDVSEIDLFDHVIMLAKVDNVGRLAFSGSPEEARNYFGVDEISKAYALLETEPEKFVK